MTLRVLLSFVAVAALVVLDGGRVTSAAEVKSRAEFQPIDGATVRSLTAGASSNSAEACQVGNLNTPAWAILSFVAPPEEYKLVFDPQTTCPECPAGILVNTIHVLLRTSQACDIQMAVDVEDAAFPNNPACAEPGPVRCNSGLFVVSLPSDGLWDISLPITCPCLSSAQLALLSVQIENSSCLPEPDLIIDSLPTACTNWNNFGSGWSDLVSDYSFPGNLNFFADADCCTAAGIRASVPAASPTGLIITALLLATIGVFAVVRRRRDLN